MLLSQKQRLLAFLSDWQGANKAWWRERLQARKVQKAPLSGMPLPVDPSYNALGQKRNDIDLYPHDDDRPPPEPAREFAQPAPPLDPTVYTWSEDFAGINHVLWEAAGENDLPLLRQALHDGAQVNAGKCPWHAPCLFLSFVGDLYLSP